MVAIATKDQVVPKAIADAACESLNEQVARKREEGALEARKSSSVRLEWTPQTGEVVRTFHRDVCTKPESNK
jgi:hypothetical protein